MAEIDAKFEELVAFKKFQSWQAIRDGDDVKNLSQLVMGSSDLKQEDENDPLYCKYCESSSDCHYVQPSHFPLSLRTRYSLPYLFVFCKEIVVRLLIDIFFFQARRNLRRTLFFKGI